MVSTCTFLIRLEAPDHSNRVGKTLGHQAKGSHTGPRFKAPRSYFFKYLQIAVYTRKNYD